MRNKELKLGSSEPEMQTRKEIKCKLLTDIFKLRVPTFKSWYSVCGGIFVMTQGYLLGERTFCLFFKKKKKKAKLSGEMQMSSLCRL